MYVQVFDGSSDGSSNESNIPESNDSARTHENAVHAGSTYINNSKPRYANIARRAIKYEQKAQKLN